MLSGPTPRYAPIRLADHEAAINTGFSVRTPAGGGYDAAVSFRLPALVVSSVVIVLAACGDSDPSEPVRDYLQAVVDQDGEQACEQLSEDLRSEIENSAAAQSSGRGCAEVMELAAALNPSLTTSDVEEVEIDVEEDGDEATATLVNPLVEREETIELVKEDGEWRIATLETRPQG